MKLATLGINWEIKVTHLKVSINKYCDDLGVNAVS